MECVMTERTYIYHSILGEIYFSLKAGELVSLGFKRPSGYLPMAQEVCESSEMVRIWLDDYFAGKRTEIPQVSFGRNGTDFQKRVWQEILKIPYGHTTSYGDIANRLCSSPRAVGSAVGRNPVCIIVPCHRVIAASGKLGGYSEGLERKRWLLNHEKVNGQSPDTTKA